MTQYAATAVSLLGLLLIRRKLVLGPALGCVGSVLWVAYAVQTNQLGLAVTELAFVAAYGATFVEWMGD